MPQRNNPMSAVQKKRTVSTTKKKGTTSSSKTSRTSKKEQMNHRTVMPVWIRNILAVVIIGCFSVVFYYFFIRPYAYRWKPCHGLKAVSYTHLDVYKRQIADNAENRSVVTVALALTKESPKETVSITAAEETKVEDKSEMCIRDRMSSV